MFIGGMLLCAGFGIDYVDPSTVRGGIAGARDYQLMAFVLAVGAFVSGLYLFTKAQG
jgi:hypothetical protein